MAAPPGMLTTYTTVPEPPVDNEGGETGLDVSKAAQASGADAGSIPATSIDDRTIRAVEEDLRVMEHYRLGALDEVAAPTPKAKLNRRTRGGLDV